jgi:hypothetical protein
MATAPQNNTNQKELQMGPNPNTTKTTTQTDAALEQRAPAATEADSVADRIANQKGSPIARRDARPLHEGVSPVQVAKWLGHNVSEMYKTYAHVIDDLDPTDRKTTEEVIQGVRSDMTVTWAGVHKGSSQSKRTRRKTSSRARSAA